MTKTPKQAPQSAPLPGVPAGATVQFWQRVLRSTAEAYRKATKDARSLPWQAVFGPGWQLTVAMAVWMSFNADDRLELCQRFLKHLDLPEETKKKLQDAVSRAMRGEPPEKSGS